MDQSKDIAKYSRKLSPKLEAGRLYLMEIAEELVPATLRRIIDDASLGRGYSFQFLATKNRVFVYEKDLQRGPDNILIVLDGP